MSKLLRNVSLLIFVLFSGAFLQAQVCTPDVQYTEVGLYPDSLVDGILGQPYEQVVHVVIPQDTSATVPPFGTIELDLCELILDSIPNLPAGMTYECNSPDCRWTVDHTPGVINRVCVTLKGVPTEVVGPDDSLLVYATVVAGAFNQNTQVCDPLQITLPDSLTTIEYKTQMRLRASTSSIEKDLADLKMVIYPNPALDGAGFVRFVLPQADRVSVLVRNASGQTLVVSRSAILPAGPQELSIGGKDWPAGMYFVEVRSEAGQLRQTQAWILK